MLAVVASLAALVAGILLGRRLRRPRAPLGSMSPEWVQRYGRQRR